MKDNAESIENKLYFNKYKPEKKIGEGSFGKIYAAINIQSNEKYALKLENKSGGQNLLESEAYVLCYLKGPGIPAVKSYGFSGEHNILVMELLGKSLEDLFQDNKCKFSLKTVCMIADQMLNRIEYIHNKHIIHRDIKPDNFVIGYGENAHIVYIIDFGLAKKYRSSRTLQHIALKHNKKLTGTARYASINTLSGVEQSRRDDLEAIGYVLMYFLRGSLPWQGLKIDKREDRYKKICDKKKATSAEELCAGFPKEFTTYINYTRNMGFDAEPNYDYLRSLFRSVMDNYGCKYDNEYDWVNAKQESSKQTSVVTTDLKIDQPKESNNNVHFDSSNANNIESAENRRMVVHPGQKDPRFMSELHTGGGSGYLATTTNQNQYNTTQTLNSDKFQGAKQVQTQPNLSPKKEKEKSGGALICSSGSKVKKQNSNDSFEKKKTTEKKDNGCFIY